MPRVPEPPQIDYEGPLSPSAQIAAWIRGRIEAGELEPGRRIPTKKELVQAFGVAETTARRAIAILRDEGFVYTVPGRGSYVAEHPPGSQP